MGVQSSTSTRAIEPRKQTSSRSQLEQSVLLTVLYADLFDYPLTIHELYDRLIDTAPSRAEFCQAVDNLTGIALERSPGFVTWTGRRELIGRRRRREERSEGHWRDARRYAAWLRLIPFVRMVAVSGSLALDNNSSDGDIDLFCIVERRRLWLVRIVLVVLSRLTRLLPNLFPRYLCPNYLLTLDALELEEQNLFTAYESIQAVPIWGQRVYQRFLRTNAWIKEYLPHAWHGLPDGTAPKRQKPLLIRSCEWLLGGAAGDVLDRIVFRLFRRGYRSRAEQRGWSWDQLKEAYRRDRYTIPEGGYIHVVRQRFRRRARETADLQVDESYLSWLFPGASERPAAPCYDWTQLFDDEYGSTVGHQES